MGLGRSNDTCYMWQSFNEEELKVYCTCIFVDDLCVDSAKQKLTFPASNVNILWHLKLLHFIQKPAVLSFIFDQSLLQLRKQAVILRNYISANIFTFEINLIQVVFTNLFSCVFLKEPCGVFEVFNIMLVVSSPANDKQLMIRKHLYASS